MANSTFDTLSVARELESKGIEPDQAEVIVKAIRRSSGDHISADQFDARFSEQQTYVGGRFSEQRAYIDMGLARLSAVFYRALWLQGAAIVGVLVGLYTFAGGG